MSKKNVKKTDVYSAQRRAAIFDYYKCLFYNLFMGKFTIKGMNYRQNDFFFRKLWDLGTVAIFRKKYLEGEDAVGLAQWTAAGWYDGLDMPTKAQFVRNRGDMSIPLEIQTIDETCVIGWAQHSHRSIKSTMDIYASKLAAIDMLITINEKVQKMPWLVNVPEGAETKIREMYNSLDNDEPVLFLDMDGIDLRALISGAPYNLDKLYNYRQAYLNDALTFLGVNNLGNVEKKERLISDEVNHNNDLIRSNNNNFKNPINEFLKRANDVLGFDFELIENETFTPEDINGFNAFGRQGENENVF